jgi:hypothetical protein
MPPRRRATSSAGVDLAACRDPAGIRPINLP